MSLYMKNVLFLGFCLVLVVCLLILDEYVDIVIENV